MAADMQDTVNKTIETAKAEGHKEAMESLDRILSKALELDHHTLAVAFTTMSSMFFQRDPAGYQMYLDMVSAVARHKAGLGAT